MSFHWTCPFCDRDTTITDSHDESEFLCRLKSAEGPRKFRTSVVVCPNPKCLRAALTFEMYETSPIPGQGWVTGQRLQRWNLIPQSSAKVIPNYVPKAICDDYLEACLIRDLSPKASATLSRRCLQGMIRDFWGVAKGRLADEIDAIKERVDSDSWEAIDSVRKIGNIGAHMERDINVIVDVEPAEAQMLIGLIELLVKDWYVTRHDRTTRLKCIVELRDAKVATKSSTKGPTEAG